MRLCVCVCSGFGFAANHGAAACGGAINRPNEIRSAAGKRAPARHRRRASQRRGAFSAAPGSNRQNNRHAQATNRSCSGREHARGAATQTAINKSGRQPNRDGFIFSERGGGREEILCPRRATKGRRSYARTHTRARPPFK